MLPTRQSLIARVKNRDDSSWNEFFALYEPLVSSYVRSRGLPPADAPDVVQETFIKLVTGLEKYEPGRGRFRTWLYQVTMHVLADYVRRQVGQKHRVQEWWERFGKTLELIDEPDDAWNQAYRRRILDHAHERIKAGSQPNTWYCYEQRFLQDRPSADIARELGITANAVCVNAGRIFDKVNALCTDLLTEDQSHE